MNNEVTKSVKQAELEKLKELAEIMKGLFTEEELAKMESDYNELLKQQKKD